MPPVVPGRSASAAPTGTSTWPGRRVARVAGSPIARAYYDAPRPHQSGCAPLLPRLLPRRVEPRHVRVGAAPVRVRPPRLPLVGALDVRERRLRADLQHLPPRLARRQRAVALEGLLHRAHAVARLRPDGHDVLADGVEVVLDAAPAVAGEHLGPLLEPK